MLFFNITEQVFEHNKYLQCCLCQQCAVSAQSKIKSLRFGLIPLFPFALKKASHCANCDCKNVPENSLSAEVPIISIMNK